VLEKTGAGAGPDDSKKTFPAIQWTQPRKLPRGREGQKREGVGMTV